MQNIVILAGNIGQTPEVRTTQSGTKITNFSLATSRPRLSEGRVLRDENGYRVMDTEWHRITCFNGLGKTVAEHCEKGMKVMVHGRIHYTKWTDAAGVDRYGCEIIAEKVDFLSRPKAGEGEDPELVDREPPRVCRRVFCSMTMRPYRVSSGLHRTPPLLLRAGCSRWGREGGGCYTNPPISRFPTRRRASISTGRSG